MSWKVARCSFVHFQPILKMDEEEIEIEAHARYLGISATAEGTGKAANVTRLKSGTIMLSTRRRA